LWYDAICGSTDEIGVQPWREQGGAEKDPIGALGGRRGSFTPLSDGFDPPDGAARSPGSFSARRSRCAASLRVIARIR
jgi:hypothetical protein